MNGRDFSFLRRPIWVTGLLIGLIAIASFVALGFWQLRRLEDRRDFVARVEARTATAAVEFDTLDTGVGDAIEFRRVVVRGVYIPSEEVLVRNRTRSGVSGQHVLTPLVLADGSAVIVDRGWVPLDVSGPPVAEAPPPSGTITVEGIIRLSETPGRFGPRDPTEGELDKISRPDIDRLQQQIDLDLAPVYVQLLGQSAAGQQFPIPAAIPDPGEGPHLGYAVQWFLFAGVVAIGLPVLAVRTATKPPARFPEQDRVSRR